MPPLRNWLQLPVRAARALVRDQEPGATAAVASPRWLMVGTALATLWLALEAWQVRDANFITATEPTLALFILAVLMLGGVVAPVGRGHDYADDHTFASTCASFLLLGFPVGLLLFEVTSIIGDLRARASIGARNIVNNVVMLTGMQCGAWLIAVWVFEHSGSSVAAAVAFCYSVSFISASWMLLRIHACRLGLGVRAAARQMFVDSAGLDAINTVITVVAVVAGATDAFLLLVLLVPTVCERVYHQVAVSARRGNLDLRTDPLTGIGNQRLFWDRVAELVGTPRETSATDGARTLGIIIADVDHFKKLNDTHGHLAGDAALVAVAQALQVAAGDISVARYGGEEFALAVRLGRRRVLALTTLAEELHVAACRSLAPWGATVSMGLAVGVVHDHEAARALVDRADQALYSAKRNGRNRIVAAAVGGAPVSEAAA